MSTALIEQDQMDQIIEIDQVARTAQQQIAKAEEQGNKVLKAMLCAKAMNTLRSLFTESITKDLMLLQGSPLGFRTDQDSKGGYPLHVVRDVAIEATLRGFRMVGNETNIIANRFYPTKEGFERVVREWPGISRLEISLEVPEVKGEVAYVAGVASWQLGGSIHKIERHKTPAHDLRIAVRVNSGQIVDAILGKAKAKMYRLIHERLSGLLTDDLDEKGTVEADSVERIETSESKVDPEVIELGAWKDAELLAHELSECKSREQVEEIYKRWLPYASDNTKKDQLVAACKITTNCLR